MRPLRRGVVVWLALILAEMAHGIARSVLLAPVVGDFRARQIAVFTGSVIILTIAWASIRWIGPATTADALRVGVVWLVLTLAFEIAFGRLVVGASWERIASDYNLLQGGLLPVGLLVLTLAPLMAMLVRSL